MGKGDNISIFNHAWIQGSDNYRLNHPVDNCNLEFVVELIDNNIREWRAEIITNTFDAVDAGRNLRIPLAKVPHEDEWLGEVSHRGCSRCAVPINYYSWVFLLLIKYITTHF